LLTSACRAQSPHQEQIYNHRQELHTSRTSLAMVHLSKDAMIAASQYG
jgi:hypothetical protein